MTENVSFEARVVLRPRSIDEVMDLALSYVRTFRRDFARLLLALVLPAMAVIAALKYFLQLDWFQVWVLAFVFAPLLERVTIAYAGRHLFGNKPSLWTAGKQALRRPFLALFAACLIPLPWVPTLMTAFDDSVWLSLSALMLFFWVFVLAWALYLSVVVVLEGLPLFAAMRRAGVLISYRMGRAIGFVGLSTFTRVLFALVAELSVAFLVSFLLQLGNPLDTLWENFGSWASVTGYLVAAPFVALARLFDYVDGRTRLEGWDIQVRLKAIATRAKEERARSLAA
ncbi:MAG: hypothetical protein U1E65_07195 [Myxococcota bacterium]